MQNQPNEKQSQEGKKRQSLYAPKIALSNENALGKDTLP